jgi:anti-sigma factor RsiW
MTCTEIQELISAYTDEILPPEHEGAMFAHLASCPDCQAFLRSTLRVRSQLRALPVAMPPEAVDRAITARFSGDAALRPRRLSVWSVQVSVPMPAAVAMAVLLIVGTLLATPAPSARPIEQTGTGQRLNEITQSVSESMRIAHAVLGR